MYNDLKRQCGLIENRKKSNIDNGKKGVFFILVLFCGTCI